MFINDNLKFDYITFKLRYDNVLSEDVCPLKLRRYLLLSKNSNEITNLDDNWDIWVWDDSKFNIKVVKWQLLWPNQLFDIFTWEVKIASMSLLVWQKRRDNDCTKIDVYWQFFAEFGDTYIQKLKYFMNYFWIDYKSDYKVIRLDLNKDFENKFCNDFYSNIKEEKKKTIQKVSSKLKKDDKKVIEVNNEDEIVKAFFDAVQQSSNRLIYTGNQLSYFKIEHAKRYRIIWYNKILDILAKKSYYLDRYVKYLDHFISKDISSLMRLEIRLESWYFREYFKRNWTEIWNIRNLFDFDLWNKIFDNLYNANFNWDKIKRQKYNKNKKDVIDEIWRDKFLWLLKHTQQMMVAYTTKFFSLHPLLKNKDDKVLMNMYLYENLFPWIRTIFDSKFLNDNEKLIIMQNFKWFLREIDENLKKS